jgi:hypothetical protein
VTAPDRPTRRAMSLLSPRESLPVFSFHPKADDLFQWGEPRRGLKNPGLAKPSGGGRRWLECEASPTQPGNNSIRRVPGSVVTGNYLKNNSTESRCVERSGCATIATG